MPRCSTVVLGSGNRFGRLLAALSLAVLLLGAGRWASAAERLNILLIVVDDLGWADLGCYGADVHRTPAIDRLARRGVRFTDAYAAAPVCSPTRASIMTGKFPARLHMTVWFEASQRPPTNLPLIPPRTRANLPLAEETIAEKLKRLGYVTAHIGKWHLGDAAHYPETQGFDINIGGTFWGAPATFFYPYRGRWSNTKEVRYVPGLPFGQPGEYLTNRLTDEAIRVLEQSAEKPFFLHMAYHTVHTPIEAPDEVVARYRDAVGPRKRHQNPTYAAMVEILDRNVARLLDKLDRLGIAERTVVILTSDNGGYINRHRGMRVTNNAPLRSGKGSLYEGGIRVPLIIRWPGRAANGRVCRQPTLSTDLHATILDLATSTSDAVPDPSAGNTPHTPASATDGLSLVPLLTNPEATLPRKQLFFHYPHYYPTTTPVSAIREGDWKLLEFFEDLRVELYNLADDLGEQHNLADQHPQRVADLRRKLHRWRRDVSAQMPVPNPDFRPKP